MANYGQQRRGRYTQQQWEMTHHDYIHTNKPLAVISKEHGIPEPTIRNRIHRYPERWIRPDAMSRKALTAKAAREMVVDKQLAVLDQMRDRISIQDIEDTAENMRRIMLIHRYEWSQLTEIVQEAIKERESDGGAQKAKLAKTLADTLSTKQASERKAWGIEVKNDDGETHDGAQAEIRKLFDEVMKKGGKVVQTSLEIGPERVIEAQAE